MPDVSDAGQLASWPRLPRGRHRLSTEEVVRSQRRRMFRALAASMSEKGYAATSVADVIGRAGVSRETFYRQFDSKQDCFEQAFDDAAELLFGILAESLLLEDEQVPPAERFDRLLGKYLQSIAAQPEMARLCLVEVYAANPVVLARRAEIQRRFAKGVAELFGATSVQDRFACETLVAAVSSMVVAHLASGDLAGLTGLRKPLVRLVRRALALDRPGAVGSGTHRTG